MNLLAELVGSRMSGAVDDWPRRRCCGCTGHPLPAGPAPGEVVRSGRDTGWRKEAGTAAYAISARWSGLRHRPRLFSLGSQTEAGGSHSWLPEQARPGDRNAAPPFQN